MSRDTIADIITSIRNADMNRKGTVRITSTRITETFVKILLREGFIENVRKHQEKNKYFLVSTLRQRRNRKGCMHYMDRNQPTRIIQYNGMNTIPRQTHGNTPLSTKNRHYVTLLHWKRL